MTPLAAAILILGIVDKGLELRLRQYEVNPALLELDAKNAEELAKLGLAIVKAIAAVGDAIDAGFEDLTNPTSTEMKKLRKLAAAA